jgi:hypothetical protein
VCGAAAGEGFRELTGGTAGGGQGRAVSSGSVGVEHHTEARREREREGEREREREMERSYGAQNAFGARGQRQDRFWGGRPDRRGRLWLGMQWPDPPEGHGGKGLAGGAGEVAAVQCVKLQQRAGAGRAEHTAHAVQLQAWAQEWARADAEGAGRAGGPHGGVEGGEAGWRNMSAPVRTQDRRWTYLLVANPAAPAAAAAAAAAAAGSRPARWKLSSFRLLGRANSSDGSHAATQGQVEKGQGQTGGAAGPLGMWDVQAVQLFEVGGSSTTH